MLTEKLANDIAIRTQQKLAEGKDAYTPADLQNSLAINLANRLIMPKNTNELPKYVRDAVIANEPDIVNGLEDSFDIRSKLQRGIGNLIPHNPLPTLTGAAILGDNGAEKRMNEKVLDAKQVAPSYKDIAKTTRENAARRYGDILNEDKIPFSYTLGGLLSNYLHGRTNNDN